MENIYNPKYVSDLFERMGPTYYIINLVSSFGFSEIWRRQCVSHLEMTPGAVVCDMMAGSGRHITQRIGSGGQILSVDFCGAMVRRQQARQSRSSSQVCVLHENSLCTSIPSESVDCVIAAFGVKTLGVEELSQFAAEINRILKPGGRFSLLEISVPKHCLLRIPYLFYIRYIIPLINRLVLGAMQAYRMLGEYTVAFESCRKVNAAFQLPELKIEIRDHFFGCATALTGQKA